MYKIIVLCLALTISACVSNNVMPEYKVLSVPEMVIVSENNPQITPIETPKLYCSNSRTSITKKLEKSYREKRTYYGIRSDGTETIEVFISEKAFTVVTSLPDGTTCIIFTGVQWTKQDDSI